MTQIQTLFIDILRAALKGEVPSGLCEQQLTSDTLLELYRLAKHHDLAQVVAQVLTKAGIELPGDLAAAMQKEQLMAVYRNGQLDFALSEIRHCLDDAKIEYIPLKGSVIRPYYPDPNMRTSCDIDVLIPENRLQATIAALEAAGYRRGNKNYHDVSMFSPHGIHLELHFNIQENMDNLDLVLGHAWKHTSPDEAGGYKFSNEFFAFHIFAHMAYHFLAGGCGIRPLMDIWVMEHKMGVTYVDAEALLEKAGIYRFAQYMSELATRCFDSGELADTSVLEYIFKGGIYGSMQNKVTVQKEATGSTLSYALKRIFLPYKTMVSVYPVLKKAPYLLPFCHVARWLRILFGGRARHAVSELTHTMDVSEKEMAQVKALRDRLGL